MRKTTPLVTGTIILTMTGFISRIIGFFYRIFLSKTFGEEGMGIYQLIAPVLALSFSFCASGIQTSISKYIASEPSTRNYKYSLHVLLTGMSISMMLSVIFGKIIYQYSEPIAAHMLLEARCAPLLRIIALSIPFASLHSCINGYFYGIKKANLPAATQLIEQLIRVGSVYYLYYLSQQKGYTLTISCAVIGLVIGEIISMLVSIIAIYLRFYHVRNQLSLPSIREYYKVSCDIFSLAIPLSANRIILNFLQSVEAVYIPNSLMRYGLSTEDALSIYGVLTGMAIPLILFPSAITNSLSVMLLPTISEAEAIGNTKRIKHAVDKSIQYCLLLGAICTVCFFLFANFLGNLLFSSNIVGGFIRTLSFICPFIYISTTLGSILHGLGKAHITFCFSLISLAIRLIFVFFAVPIFGITGYFWGLLISQLLHTCLHIIVLKKIS